MKKSALVVLIAATLQAAAPVKIGIGRVRPISWFDEKGNPAGFAIDVFREAARRENIPITWMRIASSGASEQDLASGRIDLMPAGMVTPERQRRFYVSEPWWSVEIALISREGTSRIAKLGISPIYSELAAKEFPGATLVPFALLDQRLDGVCAGKLDGALLTHGELHDVFLYREYLRQCDKVRLQSDDTQTVVQLSVITRKADESVARRLRRRIDQMALDGTLLRLAAQNPPIPTAGAVQLEKRLRERFKTRMWMLALAIGLPFLIWFVYDRRRDFIQVRTQRAELEATFQAITDGVALLDTEGNIARVNQALLKTAGYRHPGEMRRNISQLAAEWEAYYPDGSPVPFDQWPASRALRGESFVDYEIRAYRRDTGQRWWFNCSGSPVRDPSGKQVLAVVVARDITAKKSAEQELNEAHEETKKIGEELRRSNEELEAFAYTVSHDLAEPLRNLSAFADLLARRNGGRLDSDSHDYLAFITESAGRMMAMINGLLEYSRVGRLEQPKCPVDTREVVMEVLHDLDLQVEDTGAEIEVRELPTVVAWPGRLDQVFQNLIHNSIKYRKPDVRPRIVVDAREIQGAWLFCVRDNGIGFSQEHAGKIFKVFKQLHPRGQYPGTGLGLSIVKRIIERHGGQVCVESEPNVGTSFHFTLPKNNS